MLKRLTLLTPLLLISPYLLAGLSDNTAKIIVKKPAVKRPFASKTPETKQKKPKNRVVIFSAPPCPVTIEVKPQPQAPSAHPLEQAQLANVTGNYPEAYQIYQQIFHNPAFTKDERIAAQRHIISMYVENEIEMPLTADTKYFIERAIKISAFQVFPPDTVPKFDRTGTETLYLYLCVLCPDLFPFQSTDKQELHNLKAQAQSLKAEIIANASTSIERQPLLAKLAMIEDIIISRCVE